MGFFNSVSSFFTRDIPGFFNGAVSTAKNVVNIVHDDVKGVVTEVISIPKTVINRGADIVQKGQDVVGGVANNALNQAGQIGKGLTDFLGSPSFLILAGVGAYLVLTKK